MPKFAKVQVPFAGILGWSVRGRRSLKEKRWQEIATLRTWGAAMVRPYKIVFVFSWLISVLVPGAGAQSLASAPGQTAAVSAANQPGLAPIRKYIAEGWDTLTRSLDECKSVVDTKVTTTSVLYLPADFEVPAAVQKLQAQCNVQAKKLPMVIHNLGDRKSVV